MEFLNGVLQQAAAADPKYLVALGLVSLPLLRSALRAVLPKRTLKAEQGRAIVITGCDTGFGNMASRRLAQMGYTVFAGCLRDDGVAELRSANIATLHPLRMDVTNPEDVDRFAAEVEKQAPNGIYALVNNAGIMTGGLFPMCPLGVFEANMKVNYFGIVHVTQRLFPLLYKSAKAGQRPRVIMLASVAGRLGVPSMSAYNASKFAVEGLSDALRREFAELGIQVSILEPSFTKTALLDIYKASLKRQWENATPEMKELYGEESYSRSMKKLEQFCLNASKPEVVVNTIIRNVQLHTVPKRSPCGVDAKLVYVPLSCASTDFQDSVLQAIGGKDKPKGYIPL